MRIGISTSVIQRGRTGIAQYLFGLLGGLAKVARDEKFALFVLAEDRPLFERFEERFQIVEVGEEHRPPIANILWHQRELPRLCAELGLDAIHVPSYRRLPWSAPCPRVGTIHDLAPFHVAGKYDLARMFYGRVVVKRLARRQEQIIAVSRSTAADIERFFNIPRRRVRVIHNGLDHERFRQRDGSDAARFVLEKFGLRPPFFLYVARLEHPGKNHVRLIEAFELFKKRTRSDWRLAFGGSDWHGAAVIHERIAASPAREEIKALGFVSNEDLPRLYAAAGAFVYPSLFEGFGMPPLEAMACGCPVVCSARGSLGEVAANAAIIIDPENAEAMAPALGRVAADPNERERLVRAGLARAAEFSWERTAAETLEVYQGAASRFREAAGSGVFNRTRSVPASIRG